MLRSHLVFCRHDYKDKMSKESTFQPVTMSRFSSLHTLMNSVRRTASNHMEYRLHCLVMIPLSVPKTIVSLPNGLIDIALTFSCNEWVGETCSHTHTRYQVLQFYQGSIKLNVTLKFICNVSVNISVVSSWISNPSTPAYFSLNFLASPIELRLTTSSGLSNARYVSPFFDEAADCIFVSDLV